MFAPRARGVPPTLTLVALQRTADAAGRARWAVPVAGAAHDACLL